ncbi:MAG: hypothetical protein L0Y67_08885, partial [Gammaproteobacteria bacterium]|nr:hypothetical protein [Gammaproteobacteria bacterium]
MNTPPRLTSRIDLVKLGALQISHGSSRSTEDRDVLGSIILLHAIPDVDKEPLRMLPGNEAVVSNARGSPPTIEKV